MMRMMITPRPTPLLVALLLSLVVTAVFSSADVTVDELFPPNDEYDAFILDPNTIYGSPLGGYSRATASRLASVPLKFPPHDAMEEKEDDEDDDDQDNYYQTRDMYGRLYICQTHTHTAADNNDDDGNDNQLLLNDSLFAPPVSGGRSSSTRRDHHRYDSSSPLSPKDILAQERLEKIQNDPIGFAEDVLGRLEKLKGICARVEVERDDDDDGIVVQYEWCYDQNIQKITTSIDSSKSTKKTTKINLGQYDTRQIMFVLSMDDNGVIDGEEQNEYMDDDQQEIARVQDSYTNGDKCPGTTRTTVSTRRRQSEVTYQCCSADIIDDSPSQVYLGGASKTAAKSANPIIENKQLSLHIEDVHDDDDDAVRCMMNKFIVCTSLLCEDYKQQEDYDYEESVLPQRDHDFENMSIREILQNRFAPTPLSETTTTIEETLGSGSLTDMLKAAAASINAATNRIAQQQSHLQSPCIFYEPGGWWSYELCPGDVIRQYHLAIVVNSATGMTSYKKEDEYILGRHPSTTNDSSSDIDSDDDDDEWKYIVNGTDTTTKTSSYYYEEYIGGDLCDLDEIAAENGGVGGGAGGKIARAATVKYKCGKTLQMKVKEDSTCHYVVDVDVPELCHHPIFQQPVLKTPFLRCLPV